MSAAMSDHRVPRLLTLVTRLRTNLGHVTAPNQSPVKFYPRDTRTRATKSASEVTLVMRNRRYFTLFYIFVEKEREKNRLTSELYVLDTPSFFFFTSLVETQRHLYPFDNFDRVLSGLELANLKELLQLLVDRYRDFYGIKPFVKGRAFERRNRKNLFSNFRHIRSLQNFKRKEF